MTWSTVETAMWSSIEQAVSILCACLPTLRPLFSRVYGSTANKSQEDPYHSDTAKPMSNNITLSQFDAPDRADSTTELARVSESSHGHG